MEMILYIIRDMNERVFVFELWHVDMEAKLVRKVLLTVFFWLIILQQEKDKLVMELESFAHGSDKNTLKFQEARLQKLKQLKVQVRCDPTKLSRQSATRKQISAAGLLATCFSGVEFSFVVIGSRSQH